MARMPGFDLNLLRAFVAIFETRSVTQAAQRLDVTQPSISHALAKLRGAYADRLFDRGPSGLVPTGTAEQLFERFSHALAAVDDTLAQRQAFDPRSSTRRFRLAMSDIGVLFFAPPLLRRFQEEAPKIATDITEVSDSVREDLQVGKLDLAIGNLPALTTNTRSATLFREHYVCLMSAAHPTIGSRMDLNAFASARHIMVTSKASGHHLMDQVLAQRSVTRNIVARVPQFTVLPQLLEQSDLIVMLPSRVADLYVAQGGLKSLELPVAIPEFDVRAHWHVRQESSAAHRWLVEEVVNTLSRL